jgi:hypothetical protein
MWVIKLGTRRAHFHCVGGPFMCILLRRKKYQLLKGLHLEEANTVLVSIHFCQPNGSVAGDVLLVYGGMERVEQTQHTQASRLGGEVRGGPAVIRP